MDYYSCKAIQCFPCCTLPTLLIWPADDLNYVHWKSKCFCCHDSCSYWQLIDLAPVMYLLTYRWQSSVLCTDNVRLQGLEQNKYSEVKVATPQCSDIYSNKYTYCTKSNSTPFAHVFFRIMHTILYLLIHLFCSLLISHPVKLV